MTVISPFYFSPEAEVWENFSARKLLKYDCLEQRLPWEFNIPWASQETSAQFMGLEGSLPSLQDPATCPYPEQDRFQSVIFGMLGALSCKYI